MDEQRVMIVDDDPAICYTVEEVLQTAGLSARKAGGGDQCLRIVREGWRGVILLDIMMPHMNGWQTLHALQKENLLEGNIIVMLTAVNEPGEEMNDLKECVIDYIRKPFDPQQLIASVQDYLWYLQPVG